MQQSAIYLCVCVCSLVTYHLQPLCPRGYLANVNNLVRHGGENIQGEIGAMVRKGHLLVVIAMFYYLDEVIYRRIKFFSSVT